MSKNARLKFIYNGKINILDIEFKCKLLGIIPIYKSSSILGIMCIKISNNNIIVIENENYSLKLNRNAYISEIVHKVLDIAYNDSYLSDIYASKYISYSDTIKNINTKDRIDKLDIIIKSNIKLRPLDDILNSISFEEVS